MASATLPESALVLPAENALPSESLWQRHKPLFAALLVFLAVTVGIYALCVWNTGGRFVYAVDDAYIHLAMAKTLAGHGVWGVNAVDGFASADSSLAWPVQLAGLILIFGPQDWLPLALNLVCGVLALALTYQVLIGSGISRRMTFWVLLLVLFSTSLPALVLMGMEHIMQAVVDLAFVWAAARCLAAARPSRGQLTWLGVLAALVTATRYEGLFLAAAVGLTALLVRRWRVSLLVGALAALPLAVFGLYAMGQGSLWLPNSVAVKSEFYAVQSLQGFLQLLLGRKLNVFLGATAVFLPVLLALSGVAADAAGKNRLLTRDRLLVLIVALTAGMHLFGAYAGFFIRYEAYLVFLALVAVAVAWRTILPQMTFRFDTGDRTRTTVVGATVVIAALILAAPLVQRLNQGLFRVPIASKNIHDQQFQMARFIKQHYDGQPILINDLGAVAFYTDARPIDIAGLATVDVAKAIIVGKRTTAFLDQLARERQATIAILFTSWLPEHKAPPGWIKVGSWTVSDNFICDGDTLDFYALTPEAAPILKANLQHFTPFLPADVKQSGPYTQ